jgi:hypothetical protein
LRKRVLDGYDEHVGLRRVDGPPDSLGKVPGRRPSVGSDHAGHREVGLGGNVGDRRGHRGTVAQIVVRFRQAVPRTVSRDIHPGHHIRILQVGRIGIHTAVEKGDHWGTASSPPEGDDKEGGKAGRGEQRSHCPFL